MSKRCALFSPLCKHTPSQPHVARMLRNAKTKSFRANLQSLILKLITTCHPSWRLCTYLIFVKSTTKLPMLRLATLLVKKAPSELIFRLKCSDLSRCSRRQVSPPITLWRTSHLTSRQAFSSNLQSKLLESEIAVRIWVAGQPQRSRSPHKPSLPVTGATRRCKQKSSNRTITSNWSRSDRPSQWWLPPRTSPSNAYDSIHFTWIC